MPIHALPFQRDSETFGLFQQLWRETVKEELSYEKAQEYGPKLLALVGAVARWKRTKNDI